MIGSTWLGRSLFARAWVIALLVISLPLAARMATTVPPGHNAVATMFGEVQSKPYREGFHLVNPLLSFVEYDLRQQTHTWKEVEVPSQDKLKTSMDVSVTLRIEPEATPRILQETGRVDDVIAKHVTPKVRSLLREAGKSVGRSQDFYVESVQQELQTYMEQGLTNYLAPKGVIVEAVLFRDITMPKVVHNAVIQTKERQEQLEREKAQLQIVEQQAQKQVKEAEAREKAAVADANAKRTQADAEAYRIRSEAEARAQANRLIAETVTPALLHYNQVERWNGEYPKTLLSGDAANLLLEMPTQP